MAKITARGSAHEFRIAFTSLIVLFALPICQCLSPHDVDSMPRDSASTISPDAMVYHARRSFAEMIDGVDGLHVVKMYHRGMKHADSSAAAEVTESNAAIISSPARLDENGQRIERLASLRTFEDFRSEARSSYRARESAQESKNDAGAADVAAAHLSPDDVFHSKYLHWLMWHDRKRAKSVQSDVYAWKRGGRAGEGRGAVVEDEGQEGYNSVNRGLEKSRLRARQLGVTSTMGLLGATYPNG